MRAAGHVLRSHPFHHRSTLGMNRAEILREIALNDSFLREVIGSEFSAHSLAYPYGEVSLAAKFLSGRRFFSARGVQPGLNLRMTDRDHLRVLRADNRFAAETDWTTIIQSIAREKLWGVILAHGVDDSCHDYICSPERLEAIIQSAQAAGVVVLPVWAVMRHLVVPGCEKTA